MISVRRVHGGWRVYRAGRPVSRRIHAHRMDAHHEMIQVLWERDGHGPCHTDHGWDVLADAIEEVIE